MSGAIARLLAGVRCVNQRADIEVLRRDMGAFGSVRKAGAGWRWELHKDGLPGALADTVMTSPKYSSELAAWLGLQDVTNRGLRALIRSA